VPSAAPAWISLRIAAPLEVAEAVASFLLDEGAAGVVTEEDGRYAHLEAPVPGAAHARVQAALERYLASLGDIEPSARLVRIASAPVPDVDWSEVYRRHHRPVAVGRRLLVTPPWAAPAASDREVLVIEPGMAFGTGQHATTRACLEAIESAVAGGQVRSALDVGTGSGILALALARLGVERVVALDLDLAVLPLARANLDRNRARDVALVGGSLAALRAPFDLVVANLLADAIVAGAEATARLVAPRGRLVLSGLLETQTPAVEAAYPGWTVIERRAEDAWRTLTLERTG
jgi:ribosomal protein L11 methyltransferase